MLSSLILRNDKLNAICLTDLKSLPRQNVADKWAHRQGYGRICYRLRFRNNIVPRSLAKLPDDPSPLRRTSPISLTAPVSTYDSRLSLESYAISI
jgi:hypothetical protein